MNTWKDLKLLTIADLTPAQFNELVDLGIDMKKNPSKYADSCRGKTVLAIFAKPSLRTHISQEIACAKLGATCIYYNLSGSPLGVKESIMDTSKVVSQMADIVTARLKSRQEIRELAKYSTIPCFNSLDDFAHPLQMLADFMTIKEVFGKFDGLKMTFLGDCNNNVTYDLARACALANMELVMGCPAGAEFEPEPEVIEELNKMGCKFSICHDAKEACKGANIVYTDSFSSYHLDPEAIKIRKEKLMAFRADKECMNMAAPGAKFMNCLPIVANQEATEDVCYDPETSVIYQEAGNRQWSVQAIFYKCFTA